MDINLNIIKNFEEWRSKPYLCPAGVPTTGYGTTFYENGKKVTLKDPEITKERGEQLLKWYVDKFCVPTIEKYVKHQLNYNQNSALASFIYNLGNGAFIGSRLLKVINNDPNDPKIADEFMRWVNSKGKPMPGLIRRRKEESELYFSTPK